LDHDGKPKFFLPIFPLFENKVYSLLEYIKFFCNNLVLSWVVATIFYWRR